MIRIIQNTNSRVRQSYTTKGKIEIKKNFENTETFFLERDKLIAKMKLSLCMIAASTVQAQANDPYVDEILKSDFYGPILDEMKLAETAVSPTQNCCTTIKVIQSLTKTDF